MEEKRRQSLKESASLRQVGSLAPARASLIAQLVKKNICLQCRPQFNPWVRKIPWRRERLLTPVFCLENSTSCIVHGVTRSRTLLSNFHFHFTWAPASALIGSLSVYSLTDGRWGSDERERERERTRLCFFLSVIDTALERSEGGSLGAKGSCDTRHPSWNPVGITCSLCDLT